MTVEAQKLIDDLTAQDILDIDKSDLEKLEKRRIKEIQEGAR